MLLVEDDASIRETTALGLEAAGFEVTGGGRGGLAKLRSRPDDLVVPDVQAACEPVR